MSIPQDAKKINLIVLISICVALGLMILFGSLKLYAFTSKKTPLKIDSTSIVDQKTSENEETMAVKNGQVVASKTGKKYHLLDCPGAKTIAEKNRVYFENREAAEKAGLTPAANCRGLTAGQK